MRSLTPFFVILLLIGVYMATRPNRNVRNNNPLNIKESADWEGETLLNFDPVFEEFKKPKYGFRAGYIILLQYLERGDDTLMRIINKWAPASDNNHVGNYTDYLSDKMGLSKDEVITPLELAPLMVHMANFEGAKGHFTLVQAIEGVELANKESFVIARLARLGYEARVWA